MVPWLEKPYREWTADEVGATPTHQLAMACQREMFARHDRLEEWETEFRPVLWPDLMPEGYVPEATERQARGGRRGLFSRFFGGADMYARPLAGLAAAAVITALAGCGTASAPGPAVTAFAPSSPAAASVAPAVPVAATEDCAGQVTDWSATGGPQLSALTADLQSAQQAAIAVAGDLGDGADPTADETSLQTALASLQGDAGALQGNLPPACIPGMRADLSAALADYTAASVTGQQGVTEISDGNDSGGAADLNSATAEMTKGNTKVAAATADVQAFSSAS